MRPDVLRSFDRETTPRQALAHWDAVPGSLEPVRESENFVYRFRDAAGRGYYLRLAHESHRRRAMIEAELDFVTFLAGRGADVASAVPSRGGSLIETMDTPHGAVHAAAFNEVHGTLARWGTDAENRKILFERGAALGRLHRIAQSYRPPPGRPTRVHWWQDDLFASPQKYFPPSEQAARREYQDLAKWMLARPRLPENYGMVHGDFGTFNTLRRDGTLVAYDFDDCCFHWYAYDIAVSLRSARKLPEHYRKSYTRVVLEGYATEKDLCDDGPETIDRFARLASLYRFVASLRTFGRDNLEPEQQAVLDERRQVLASPPKYC